ncbi:MAG: hypothetical protein KME03_00930 [Aphanocapsa lilacina HA4352-LM1]|jgi:uncharacterized repeat protein (TIGR03803 family)|nr:hypothetical protein [Aphanocapsa lilacina HA4352-LM1]
MERYRQDRRLWVALGALSLLIALQATARAQLATLYQFDGRGGSSPYAGIVQGREGHLYGSATTGGAYGKGTLYRLSAAGEFKVLHSFRGKEGAHPVARPAITPDGSLYGTTSAGGVAGRGTLYRKAPNGALTTLHSFESDDGGNPFASLLLARDGHFYGTTSCVASPGLGTIFRLAADGRFKTLHTFKLQEGSDPFTGLVEGSDGQLYGTTVYDGPNNGGTVYRFSAAAGFSMLHAFQDSDSSTGTSPRAALMLAGDGHFYGTTVAGGSYGLGTVFKLSPEGEMTTLHSFRGVDGSRPYGSLIQGKDGRLYGTTVNGGKPSLMGGSAGKLSIFEDGDGTLFALTLEGRLKTLHVFGGEDGSHPVSTLVQGTDGHLYGTTAHGGRSNQGTVFKFVLPGERFPAASRDNPP